MKSLTRWSVLAFAALCAVQAQAQTADEVVERHLAALGGRAALAKLDSRIARGTITVSIQGVDISGPIETYNKAPNKARNYSKLDLSQFGAGEVVVDSRCDGKAGFLGNSMQGDRDLSGNQLQSMLNATFPTPLLNYKDAGAKIELTGKDKVGDRAVYVLLYTPKAGLPSRQYFDAENYQLLRVVAKVDIPELGGETEQTTDLSDYREVDGVKLPFTLHILNSAQAVTISLSSVEHNKPIDEAMFSKPVK
jgi:outer membrane lipoprotein-sorting protein